MTDEKGKQENKHKQDRIFKHSLGDTHKVNESGLRLSFHRLISVYVACCRCNISLPCTQSRHGAGKSYFNDISVRFI